METSKWVPIYTNNRKSNVFIPRVSIMLIQKTFDKEAATLVRIFSLPTQDGFICIPTRKRIIPGIIPSTRIILRVAE